MGINLDFKRIGIKAVEEAGEILMKNFGRVNRFSLKEDKSIVSSIDNSAEEKIIELLGNNFPSHGFFGEEAGGKITNDYVWIIDALDGTTNYISGVPVFCVSLALFYNKKPIVGLIYNPVTKKLYFSEKEKGFYVNGKKITMKDSLFSDNIMLLGKGKGKNNFLKMSGMLTESIKTDCFRTYRMFGSAALDLCAVASKKASIFILPGANFWDVAAGVLMVREAGGAVVDFEGKEWNLKSNDLIASNDKEICKLFIEKCLKKH